MTGRRGPKSKDDAVRRNTPNATTTFVDAENGAPELVGEFRPEAREWWDAFVSSPQSSLYSATDWQTLRRGVMLVHLFFGEPTAGLAAEIRQIESKLGGTIADRDRLGWKFEKPSPEPEGPTATPSRARPDPRA